MSISAKSIRAVLRLWKNSLGINEKSILLMIMASSLMYMSLWYLEKM